MENDLSKYFYSVSDINMDFNMGFKSAVFILEKSVRLTP